MQAVLLAVAHVVDQVRRARQQAQHDERPGDLRGHERAVDHAGGAGGGEDEQVLGPLTRAAGAHQHTGRKPPTDGEDTDVGIRLAVAEQGLGLLNARCGSK